MDRAERDRIEAMARRTALEVLHSATLGMGELSQLAVARAISEAIAAVMADHDVRRARRGCRWTAVSGESTGE